MERNLKIWPRLTTFQSDKILPKDKLSNVGALAETAFAPDGALQIGPGLYLHRTGHEDLDRLSQLKRSCFRISEVGAPDRGTGISVEAPLSSGRCRKVSGGALTDIFSSQISRDLVLSLQGIPPRTAHFLPRTRQMPLMGLPSLFSLVPSGSLHGLSSLAL